MLPIIDSTKQKLPVSVVALSLHKSGSTLLTKLLRDWSNNFDYCFCDIPGYIFGRGGKWPTSAQATQFLDSNQGTIWGGYRHIPGWLEALLLSRNHEYKVISLTRNPLDALTSMYFSHKKSHIVPKQDGPSTQSLLIERKRLQELSLVDYFESVIEDDIAGKNTLLQRYRHHFEVIKNLNPSNLIKFDYDTFVYRKYEGLSAISEFITQVPASSIDGGTKIYDIVASHDLFPIAEKDTQHVRNVMPGDFFRKILPPQSEVIAQRIFERLQAGHAIASP